MKYDDLAQKIVQYLGGKDNVLDCWHCVTRLRFTVKDKNKIQIENIKNLKEVMGTQWSKGQFQIIIGNTVNDAFNAVEKFLNSKEIEVDNKREGPWTRIISALTSIFTPILPALAGTGLIKGFLTLAAAMKWINTANGTYIVLNILSDSVFYFLPFLLAVSAARFFKVNEFLSLALAGVLLYPTMINAANAVGTKLAVDPIKFLSIFPVPWVKYNNSVIPIILSVWLFKYVYLWIKKWMPDVLDFMFTPMLAFIIVVPIELVVLGPLGQYAGELVANGLTEMFKVAGPIAGLIFGATYPLMILTGMHHALAPVAMNSIATMGYDNMIIPINEVTNIAQSGAAFGVALRSRDNTIRQLGWSSGFSALMGITEPAMYGVNLKLKKPFYFSMLSSGIGGAILGYFNIKCFAMGVPGLPFITAFVDKNNGMNFIWTVLAVFISFMLSFILSFLFGNSKPQENTSTKAQILAPVAGKVENLNKVNDQTFSSEVVGKGIAIIPNNDMITAPISGKISILPDDTKHAIGIIGDNGIEILVHIGVDTVELNGKGFDSLIKVGDHVQKGQLLEKVNFKFIKNEGYDPVVIVVITNTSEYKSIETIIKGKVKVGQPILKIS